MRSVGGRLKACQKSIAGLPQPCDRLPPGRQTPCPQSIATLIAPGRFPLGRRLLGAFPHTFGSRSKPGMPRVPPPSPPASGRQRVYWHILARLGNQNAGRKGTFSAAAGDGAPLGGGALGASHALVGIGLRRGAEPPRPRRVAFFGGPFRASAAVALAIWRAKPVWGRLHGPLRAARGFGPGHNRGRSRLGVAPLFPCPLLRRVHRHGLDFSKSRKGRRTAQARGFVPTLIAGAPALLGTRLPAHGGLPLSGVSCHNLSLDFKV
jgi:hypothetical protein